MEDGQTLQQVIDKWSSDPGLRKNRGITGFFPVTDRRPIGEIASEMEVGQQYGPVKTSDGFVYFELLGRKDEGTAIDTAGDARWRSARDELLRMKQKGILDTFLAQVGQERGFVVYEDRLKKISVSSVPMMTFRMVGFGGRMVAVPFVQKELNWLDINPPAQKILP